MDFFLFGLFLFLVLVSYYYYSKNRKFWGGLFGLILISYLQGILLALIFYRDNYFLLFIVSVFGPIFYYLLFSKFVPLISIGRQMKKSSESKLYSNEHVYSQCTKIWNIPKEKCLIRVFSGENSFNALTNIYSLKFNILIGEKLIEALNDEEILFLISHEIAHKFKPFRNIAFRILFLILYIVICYLVALSLIAFKIASINTFFISGIFLFLIGVIFLNYIQWIDEYSADRKAVQTTNNIESAVTAFQKISDGKNKTNHCMILELIISDHPITDSRISKIKELS